MPYVGARDPEAIDIEIKTVGGFDLSTITSADITVVNQRKKVLTWTWSIVNATSTTLHLVHTFAADGTDAETPGRYTIGGWLISSSTRRRIKPVLVSFETYTTTTVA